MTRSTRCLVLGSSGQVARSVVRHLAKADLSVAALGRRDIDLADPAAARRAILARSPDIVINAAAYTAVDRAEVEPEAAFALNATGPAAAAAAAAELGVPFLHFSTDYVFDGLLGSPYAEGDQPRPLGVYGRSKLAGERSVAEANARHLILRTAWVFSPDGANFLTTMLKLAMAGDEVGVVDDQRGNPTSADDLADATSKIVRRLLTDHDPSLSGLFHLTGGGDATWCDFARAIMEGSSRRGGPAVRVRAITTAEYPTPAPRPADTRLDGARIRTVFGIKSRPWREALDDALDGIYGLQAKDCT